MSALRIAPFQIVAIAGLLAAITAAGGCQSVAESSSRKWAKMGDQDAPVRTLQSERGRYQADRDPAAMRWLLAHQIQSHMTVADINNVFGEDGTRVYDDAWLKKGNGYRTDDVVFRWGPDKNGRNIYLVFREKRLINFDPKEYE
jgi:hypothetical protein